MSDKATVSPLPLVCPYCGGYLLVEMKTEGWGYMSQDVLDAITCEKCYAEWDRFGQPKPFPHWAPTQLETEASDV